MSYLRRSRLPGLMLLLILGFGVLLPEIGHSLAHRDATRLVGPEVDDHGHGHDHDGPEADEVHGQPDMTSVGTQTVVVHPHFELRPIAPNKTSFSLALVARTVVEFIPDAAPHSPPIGFAQDRLVLTLRNHGPPPPSRAPPLS